MPFLNGDEAFFRMIDVSLPVQPLPILEAEELVFVHAAEMFGVAKVEGE